jgi:hypothetical protein
MASDYVYPSVFLAYLLFFLCFAGAIFFFFRSVRDGYWGKHSEDVKYLMMTEDEDKIPGDLDINSGDEHARPESA